MTRFKGSSIPALPPFPPALHVEIGLAHLRARELASRDRELHFACDDAGGVVVELRTLAGRLICRIPAAMALEIINGDDLDAALRAVTPERERPRPPEAP